MVSRERACVAGAGLLAVALPLLLSWPRAITPPSPIEAVAPIRLAPAPAMPARAMFGAAEVHAPTDGPQLVGIVGRLPSDAVALVRTVGGVRSVRPGEAVDGWTLTALSTDAAAFTRGGERLRVALAGE